jgi:hypothetical protein
MFDASSRGGRFGVIVSGAGGVWTCPQLIPHPIAVRLMSRFKSHVSRRISLAFMAPDIVEKIMSGSQSIELTPERLKKACPLPASWEERRALLLS